MIYLLIKFVKNIYIIYYILIMNIKILLIFTVLVLFVFMNYFVLIKIDDLEFKFIKPKFKTSNNCIPKIIYKTGPMKVNKLPKDILKIFNDTIELNPDYKIKYFDDDMCRMFIKNNFSKNILDTYDNLIPGAYKADLFRYCILYKNGGIYSDLTQQFYIPFSKIINNCNDKLILVKDARQLLIIKSPIQINFMASISNQEIFKLAINKIFLNVKNKYYGSHCLEPTGPILFRKCFDEIKPKYKMEIIFKKKKSNEINVTGGYIYNTGKLVYINKSSNHTNHIKPKSHYGKLWKSRNIYKNKYKYNEISSY